MTNRKWMIALAAFFLVFLYLLSHFAYSYIKISDIVGEVADNLKAKTFAKHHIVLISQELDNPFWRTIEHGAQEEAVNYNMDLEYIGPFRLNQSEQMMLLDKTIASKVDGILVQGIETEEYRALIQKAIGRGIPVITVDTDTVGSKRITYVGTDNVSAGKELGKVVLKSMHHTSESPKLRIGIIIASHDALNQEERLQGFLSIVQTLKNVEIVNVGVSNISRIQATQATEKMLKDDPGINLMIGTSALDAVGILQAVKSLHRMDSVKIFGFDDLEDTKLAISKGEIEATIIQKPEEMGREAIKELHAYFEGRASQEGMHLTSYQVLDRSNIMEAMNREH